VSKGDFAIAWTAPARRALARLPEKVATAAVEFLYGSLAANPHRVGKPLKLGLDGLHSARRGDYRVDDQHRRVDVLAIEHRSGVVKADRFADPGMFSRGAYRDSRGVFPVSPGQRLINTG
jgi:mRNA interferase RelE/StbE